MNALVLDGDCRSALAIVRSLGKRGITVTVASHQQPCLAGRSRFCSRRLTCPHPGQGTDALVEWLHRTLAAAPRTVVYAVTDVTVSALGSYRHDLPASALVPLPPQEALAVALDKTATVHLAEGLGIPVPRTVVVHPQDDIDQAELPLPAAIKAARSDYRHRQPVAFALDREGLLTALRRMPSAGGPALVQELIAGEGAGVFALFRDGEPLVTFAHRRRLEKPPWGGVSVLSESVPQPGPELPFALRILRHLNWHGVAMVEFRCSPDGTPYLMEINPRFWGSLELAVRSGVDFPYLFHEFAAGRPAVHPRRVRRCANRWLLGELDSLVTALRSRSRPDGQSVPRAHALLRHLATLRHGLCCEVERLTDPGPAIYEHSQWLRGAAQVVFRPGKGEIGKCTKDNALEV